MSSRTDQRGRRYRASVGALLAAVDTADDALIGERARALADVAWEYARTPEGAAAVARDAAIAARRAPGSVLAVTLAAAVPPSPANARPQPASTLAQRRERAARLRSAADRAAGLAAAAPADEEKMAAARRAHAAWRDAERAAATPMLGDRYRVVGRCPVPIGATVVVLRTHPGTYGLRLLVRTADSQDAWVSADAVERQE